MRNAWYFRFYKIIFLALLSDVVYIKFLPKVRLILYSEFVFFRCGIRNLSIGI